MKKNKNLETVRKIHNSKSWITLVALLVIFISFIIIISIIFITRNQTINSILNSVIGEQEITEPLLTYIPYDNQDLNNIKALVTINSTEGIEYFITPENNKINTNLKKTVSFDMSIPENVSKTFIIKEKNKNEISKAVTITQDDINNCFTITDISNDPSYTNIKIEYPLMKDTDVTSYIIGDIDTQWTTYYRTIQLDMSCILDRNPDDSSWETGKTKIKISKKDKAGNVLNAEKSNIDVSSTYLDFFRYLKIHKVGTDEERLNEYGFTWNFATCENSADWRYAKLGMLGGGHGSYSANWNYYLYVNYQNLLSKFENIDFNSLIFGFYYYNEYRWTGEGKNYATKLTLNYDDNTSETITTGGYSGNGAATHQYEINMEGIGKEIETITVNLSGWDGDYVCSLGYINKIILKK